MHKGTKFEVRFYAEVCVLRDGESILDVDFFETASAPLSSLTEEEGSLRWKKDSSWESFDKETRCLAFHEVLMSEHYVRMWMGEVYTSGKFFKTMSLIEEPKVRTTIELGERVVPLDNGSKVFLAFSLDMWREE